MSAGDKSFLFGPVPSRRLGISLGVDLVPRKTCSMDCVYCESGKTTCLTVERREFHPTDAVIAELDAYLAGAPELDYITFSGAGEPTLHSGIGEIIAFLKSEYPEYKTCLLTNAMLLPTDETLFGELKPLDLIVPSLDSAMPEIHAAINRPAAPVDIDALINALARFKKESAASMHLEIFIVKGLNDTKRDVAGFADAIRRIKPDKVQINSLDRPGTEDWVEPADIAFLRGLEA
ncbi:MAG: radical SAM protein, partial [Kiritimatiellaeota bacterium]|nr:radical SAM protein [Kiritimatiellota bacterium]